MMNLVLTDVEPFVRDNDHLAPATRAHQMEIFNSPGDSKDLELELAAFVDGGNHFVSATYYLEGDRLLVFSCYERLATVSNENVCAFCSARLCCPVQVQQLHSTAASVEELRRFRFLDNDAIIQGLTAELPRYLAVADGADLQTEEEKLQWWSRNEANPPNWSSVVKKVLLVQPSSASAERVFSIMKNFFTNQQDAALEQTVEASVMLCYNQNQRNKLVVV